MGCLVDATTILDVHKSIMQQGEPDDCKSDIHVYLAQALPLVKQIQKNAESVAVFFRDKSSKNDTLNELCSSYLRLLMSLHLTKHWDRTVLTSFACPSCSSSLLSSSSSLSSPPLLLAGPGPGPSLSGDMSNECLSVHMTRIRCPVCQNTIFCEENVISCNSCGVQVI